MAARHLPARGFLEAADRYAEALELSEQVLALARRRGNRRWESNVQTGVLVALFLLGRWDEALAIAAEEEPRAATGNARAQLLEIARIHCERGELEPADRLLAANRTLRDNDNRENRTAYAAVEARLLRAHGRAAEALAASERGLASLGELPITDTYIKEALLEAVEAALALGDLGKAQGLLAIPETLDRGQLTPLLEAHASLLRARLDAACGHHEQIDERFRASAALYRESGFTFHQAVAELEHAEWLITQKHSDEAQPLLGDAHEILERLKATPWLERTARATLSRFDHKAATS